MNRTLLLPAWVASALFAAACSPNAGQTAGKKVDEAVAQAKVGAEEAKQSTKEMANSVTAGATDATITAKVNAALAADDRLKATKINVDTSQGHVVLTGSAPDADARERATVLANAVKGVVAVDNRLTVTGG